MRGIATVLSLALLSWASVKGGMSMFLLIASFGIGLGLAHLVVKGFSGMFPESPFNETCKVAVGTTFACAGIGILIATSLAPLEIRMLGEVSGGFILGLSVMAFLIVRPPKPKKKRFRSAMGSWNPFLRMTGSLANRC